MDYILTICDIIIVIRSPDHTSKHFDFEGIVLVDFVINNAGDMKYATTQLEILKNENGYSTIYNVAKCQ